METTPAIDTAIDYFDVRSDEGSTVRFYNAAEEEFMKLRSDRVGKLYQPLFDEELVGVRHAEDGMLHAVLNTSDGGATYEKTVGGLPFAEMVIATRPYAEGEADGLL